MQRLLRCECEFAQSAMIPQAWGLPSTDPSAYLGPLPSGPVGGPCGAHKPRMVCEW